MRSKKILTMLAALAIILTLCVPAMADSALVVTPKGNLNLRKSPTTDSNRVASIPNHTIIEILDVDGEWAKATYNGKTGFVMTKFLRIDSQLAGKTVYDNEYGLLLLRAEPSASAPAVMPADSLSGIPVTSVENGWATVTLPDETTVYADASRLTFQVEDAPKTLPWIAERGEITYQCTLRADDGQTAVLEPGTPVTVTARANLDCLVVCEAGCGYVPMASVLLYGVEDAPEDIGKITAKKALSTARDALSAFRGTAKEKLTAHVAQYVDLYGNPADAYQVSFFREDGEYAYAMLISAATGKVLYKARCGDFSSPLAPLPPAAPSPEPTPEAIVGPAPVITEIPVFTPEPAATPTPEPAPAETTPIPVITEIPFSPLTKVDETPASDGSPAIAEFQLTSESSPAPAGQPAEQLVLQPAEQPASEAQAPAKVEIPEDLRGEASVAITDGLELGDVLDIEVTAWTDHEVRYTITKDGQMVAGSGPVRHFTAAYRPRTAGKYVLSVDVKGDEGKMAHLDIDFNVTDADVTDCLYELYSQKDGWWADDVFGASSLEADGAAIFTLTHGMSLVGVDSTDMLPENLVKLAPIVDCIVDGKVDNAKLVAEAANLFGFKTQEKALTDAAQISDLLKKGAVFSFTNAQGNVVLAAGLSEDGQLVRILDAAPSLSFPTLDPDTVFFQQEDGRFTAAASLEDNYDCRWFFETDSYGGLEYWQRLSDIAPLGLLLMQPAE